MESALDTSDSAPSSLSSLSSGPRASIPAPPSTQPASRRRTIFLPRFDMYGPIHKTLRLAFAQMLVRLGALDVGDTSALAATLDDLEKLLGFVSEHIRHEEDFIHGPLEARRPGVTPFLVSSHDEHELAASELRVLHGALRIAAPDTRLALRRALYLRFSAFVADQLAHMLDEEEIVQPILDEAFTAAELEAINGAIVFAIPPPALMETIRMMLPALDPGERVDLLAGPKKGLPPEAFAAVLGIARDVLSASAFAELEARLASC